MTEIEIGLWTTGGMLLMVFLGMRVAFAAGLAGFAGLVWLRWNGFDYDPNRFWKAVEISAKIAGQVPHSKVSAQALSLIPTFILIGYLAYHAKLTTALFEAAKRWIAWVPGGLAVSTVFATAGFAAVSGASVATAAVFARIAIPEMLKVGYNKQFAAGVVAAGGTLASLIPPSAILVIYAIIVEQDVGKLLLAGFIPGAFSALVYAVLIISIAVIFKTVGPPVGGFTWRERLVSLPPALPIVAVVVIIIFFVYNPFGDAWGTPTEGGAVGAFIVFLMALYRGMRLKELGSALLETAKLTVMIFTIIWGVLIYVRFLGFADLPGAFCRLDHLADRFADVDPDLHPSGLCGAGHVHGCHRDALADASRRLSGGHGAEWRRNGHSRRKHLRHVRDHVRHLVRDIGGENGRVLSDHAAHRTQLFRCCRRAPGPFRSGCLQRRDAVLHRGRHYHCLAGGVSDHCAVAAKLGVSRFLEKKAYRNLFKISPTG